MFEELTHLVERFGQDSIVNNQEVPNEHNEAVMNETSISILSGLQGILAGGGAKQIAGLFEGNNAQDASNPVVQQLTQQLSGNLGQKFGLNDTAASNLAGGLIPKVLGSLIGNAKDPNYKGFGVSDLVTAISGGNGNSGLMNAISKYGGQFGLDQNADGQVNMQDAITAVSKKSGGLGGLLRKIFGR